MPTKFDEDTRAMVQALHRLNRWTRVSVHFAKRPGLARRCWAGWIRAQAGLTSAQANLDLEITRVSLGRLKRS